MPPIKACIYNDTLVDITAYLEKEMNFLLGSSLLPKASSLLGIICTEGYIHSLPQTPDDVENQRVVAKKHYDVNSCDRKSMFTSLPLLRTYNCLQELWIYMYNIMVPP